MIKIDPERNVQSTLLWLLDEVLNNNIAFIRLTEIRNREFELVISNSYMMRLIDFNYYKNMAFTHLKFLLEIASINPTAEFKEIPASYDGTFSQFFRFTY